MTTTPEPSRPGPPGSAATHQRVEKPVSSFVTGRMSRQRRRDTAPEVALRKVLHRRGFRFRVDHPLPGMPRRRADVVLSRVRLAVFVDGCFWHACPQHVTWPATREQWWRRKLEGNVARDRDTDRRLRESGWAVLRIWEHEDPEVAADRVEATYRALRDACGPP